MLPVTMLLWAGNSIVGRAAAPDIGPMALSFWRWLLALCILMPFAWPHLRAQRTLIAAHWARLLLFGVLGIAAFTSLHYIALRHTTAISSSLLATTIPAAIVGTSWLLFRETVSARAALGMAVAFLGVVAIVAKADAAILLALDFNDGDLVMLLNVVIWSLYSVLLRYRPPGLHGLAFLAAIIASGLAVIGPLYALEVARGLTFVPDWKNLAMIGYIGVFPSLVAYVFYNAGVEALEAEAEAEAETVTAMWERAKEDEWADWGYALHPDAAEVMKPAFRLMRSAIRSAIKSRDPARAEQVREVLRKATAEIRALNGE